MLCTLPLLRTCLKQKVLSNFQPFLSLLLYSSKDMRILVVEDTKRIAEALQKGLNSLGYSVDIALDGEQGFDLASTEPYGVIILDLMLPGMDGSMVCSELRKAGISTPILMLTAKGTVEDRVAGLTIGADDYLPKPFAFEELVARVKALARRPAQLVSDILVYKDITLDAARTTVTRNNVPVILSKREFALLEYLLRNAELVLSKEQLLSNVWEFDADVLPNTVEVYMGYLRSKLEKPFPKLPKLFTTVRGFGYSLGKA